MLPVLQPAVDLMRLSAWWLPLGTPQGQQSMHAPTELGVGQVSPCHLLGTQPLTLNDIALQGTASLGRQPKNAQLLEAVAQHRNAKLRTVPWLLGIIERYHQGRTAWHT